MPVAGFVIEEFGGKVVLCVEVFFEFFCGGEWGILGIGEE